MAAALDSNRKIQNAGRDGRDVYLWVLRQVALRDSDGDIPLADVRDFRHVARQLMCTPVEVEAGLDAAVREKLLAVTDDRYARCVVVGWDGDWGRRPMTNAERQAKWRANNSNRDTLQGLPPVASNELTVTVTEPVTRNVGEERRGEESRDRVTNAASPDEVLRLATPSPRVKPTRPRQVKHPLPDEWTPNLELTAEARTLGLDPLDQASRMRNWARGENARKADWDGTFQNWIRREADRQPRRNGARGLPEV